MFKDDQLVFLRKKKIVNDEVIKENETLRKIEKKSILIKTLKKINGKSLMTKLR